MAFEGRKKNLIKIYEDAIDIALDIREYALEQDEVWKAIKTVALLEEKDPIAMTEKVASEVFTISEEVMRNETQGEFGSNTKVALIAVVRSIEYYTYKIVAGEGVVGLLFALGDFGKGLYDIVGQEPDEWRDDISGEHQTVDGAIRKSFELLARFGLNNKNCKAPDGVKNAYNTAKAEYHPRKGTYPNKRNWIRHYSAAQFLNTERGKAFLKKTVKKSFFLN
jgi:hypothetical protein